MVAGLVAPLASRAGNTAAAEPNYSVMSVDQLEKLITKLQTKLAEMKKGSACFVSDKDLSIGDGEDDDLKDDVKRLQQFLKEKGYFGYGVTGYFGKATRTSVVAFQTAQGIGRTGEFDGATRAKAHALTCKVAKKAVVAEKKAVKEEDKEESKEQTGVVKSIVAKSEGERVTWTVDGYSKNGFKVVWSKTSNPTYPNRETDRYQYFSESGVRSSNSLEAFNGAGTYYVRVCEYLGGACGTYSNSVTVSLQ
jgi:peptidoglycan hydrolase-like protein with peptidoglycan-binding domain